MPVLTSLRISPNFKGVTNEIGRCPFAKILSDDAYICSWVINSLYNVIIYLALFLNIAVNLWNSDVNPVNLHKVI